MNKNAMKPSAILALAVAAALAFAGAARADAALSLTIKDHRFSPAEITAPANTPITITVRNLDSTPEEFESKHLRVEKVIAPNGSATFHVRPLAPGRYRFFGDFHEDTAEGYLVVE